MQGTGQSEVWDKAAARDLRGAAYRGDGYGVMAALAGRPLETSCVRATPKATGSSPTSWWLPSAARHLCSGRSR